MSAINFIQQHGVDKAREVVEGAPEASTHLSGFTGQIYKDSGDVVYVWDGMKYHKSIYEHTRGMISLSDLMRLVDSVDKVNSFGGLEDSKAVVKMGRYYKYLKKAIADYEAIYSNTSKNGGLEDLRDCDTSPNCKKYQEQVK